MIDQHEATVVSLSGGKDSTAMALLAIEREVENLSYVFADTGHEHPLTYEYLDYLRGVLGEIHIVKADFADAIERKRCTVATKWRQDGVPESRVLEALDALQPTGIPFLDMCLAHGRFPSTRARFCSVELKHVPLDAFVADRLDEYGAVFSWQGVRRDESRARRDLSVEEDHASIQGLTIYRPILDWTAKDCFEMHARHGVKPNPLYKLGMSRVGCMPCIHARKAELFEIQRRFPAELERVKRWESLVSTASKRNSSTFFPAKRVGRLDDGQPAHITHGIDAHIAWSKTTRGGRHLDLIAISERVPACSSLYGLCE